MALTAGQVGDFGERHVEAWLRAKGFTNILRDTKQLGSTDIQADGSESILVQVKTAVHPDQPAQLSADEIRDIKSRATKLGRVAYVARVTIDFAGGLVGTIAWSN